MCVLKDWVKTMFASYTGFYKNLLIRRIVFSFLSAFQLCNYLFLLYSYETQVDDKTIKRLILKLFASEHFVIYQKQKFMSIHIHNKLER